MKKIKFITLVPSVALATVTPICACSQTNQAQDIVDAIFGPLDIKTPKNLPVAGSFEKSLKTLNQEELNNELFYDLFGLYRFGVPPEEHTAEMSSWIEEIRYLYENGAIQIKTNITRNSLAFDDKGDLCANFLGYVSFVFIKESSLDSLEYKVNDYFMLTYDLFNIKVQINEENCTLIYKSSWEGVCIGFIKTRFNGGIEEHMAPIESMNIVPMIESSEIPHNSKNWTKTA